MFFRESETVELKEVVVNDIKKEIIAFSNCEGGKIYIGVRDDGEILGLEDADDTALKISNMVRDAIKPDLTMFLHYETLTMEQKSILVVDVQRGTERPYYIAKKGLRPEGVYVRQGYSSVPATDTAIRKMIKETDGDHFEEMRSLEQNLTFESAEKEFAERNLLFGDVQKKTLGILNQDDIYTNLGLLLSEQCVHTIKAAVFEGNNQSIFKDRREFTGSLFHQMRSVYDYIDFHNKTRSMFDKLRRIDLRDYPEEAVREALLNSLVHREYSFRASTFISIFSDRMEFTSIGGLVSGVALSDIMMEISVCRNVKLANIFYRLELIEVYGTGIQKIMNAYDTSVAKPKVETSDNAFKIILPNLNTPIDSRETNSEMQKILQLATEKGRIVRKDVDELLGVGQSTSGRLLKQMEINGQIVKEGKGKNTYYRPSN